MNGLDREHLFDAELPAGVAPLCAGLARLEAITREQKALDAGSVAVGSTEAREAAQQEARAVYAQLLVDVAPFALDDRAPSLGSPAELRARFVDAVLLWMQFCRTSSLPLVDSLDTRSIRAFPLDLPPDAAACAELGAALAASQGLSAAELGESERRVARATRTLRRKLDLTRALTARLCARGGPSGPGLSELMREFYGPLPLRPGDVDLVVTSSAIFFVLPLHGERFDVPDWDQRPEAERAAIASFLARFARENLKETWRFPAFGLFDPAALAPALLDDLARATHTPPDSVRQRLCTMVNILPKAEIDQYLVHDAWGHTWQEVLNEFESDYASLRSISEALSPSDGPRFGGAGVAALGDAFCASDGRTRLDEARLLASAEADLYGRVQIGLSQVLSEVLADFVEAKFSRLEPARPLPTSSLLPSQSMKLDLTIQDMLRQARRSSRPYRDLWSKPPERARWAVALRGRGLPEAGLDEAVAAACRVLEARFGAPLRPSITGAGADTGSSVATRALLELTLLCRELERVLDETSERSSPAWLRPEYCPDLWAVGLSHLYEADRQNRFWSLDTLLRNHLRGACRALGSELDTRAAPGAAPWYRPDMANQGVLAPLFTNLPISADEAVTIAGALRDIAQVDGSHVEEEALIQSLVQELADDLGETPNLPTVTPNDIAHKLIDPTLRIVFLQTALLLALADGKVSAPERERIREYATALNVSGAAYAELERVIEGWVRSGDLQTLFA
jgi:tellurite resistance protein